MPSPFLQAVPRREWALGIANVCRPGFSGFLGVEIAELGDGLIVASMTVKERHLLFPGGLVHGGTVLGFADNCAGWGCLTNLPEGVEGFTTLEAKSNLVASAKEGDVLTGRAECTHAGKTTQVWDVVVTRDRGEREVALFRCTQALLAKAR